MNQRLAVLVCVCLCATPVTAAPIVYSDRAAFDAAIGPRIMLDFDRPFSCGELRADQGTCRADAGEINFEFESFFYQKEFVDVVPIIDWSATMAFDRPMRAIGFDLIGQSRQPYFITVATANSPVQLTSYLFTGDAFFGLLLEEGSILGIGLNPFGLPANGGAAAPFAIDNVTLTVPEPGTGFLVAGVLVGLLARRSRRLRR
jgi:hypothetical protein